MSDPLTDERFDALQLMMEDLACLNFSKKLKLSDKSDRVDAIAAGLNMLSEELESNVVERKKLTEINESLQRFSAIAAHGMKTPLRVSKSLAILLKHELKDHDNNLVKEYIDQLKDTNANLNKMITSLLEYSKYALVEKKIQEVNLAEVFHEAAIPYCNNPRIEILTPNSLPVIWYSKPALLLIIRSLLDNAVKYNDKDICCIKIECMEQDQQFLISIKDNGPGIQPENFEKVFDLFENINVSNKESTGIGLAVVKNIVNDHNGRIWIDPSEEQGAKFVFFIKKTT